MSEKTLPMYFKNSPQTDMKHSYVREFSVETTLHVTKKKTMATEHRILNI